MPEASGPVPADPTALARAEVYLWLAGLFARELSDEALAAYRGAEGHALLERLGARSALAPAVARLRALAERGAAAEPAAKALAGDFARLFLGAGGRHGVPPYESAYGSERGLLFQEPTTQTAAVIRELDLRVADGFPEPPDHLAVQLSVMAELARREDAAARQLWFLESRLLSWIEAFRDDCAATDRAGFYATAAASLAAFALDDAQRLRAEAPFTS